MNKLNFFLFLSLTIGNTHSMDLIDLTDLVAHRTGDPFEPEWQIPHHYPQDLGECLIRDQLLDIHNQVNTPKEARDYLINVSLVNRKCNIFANDPHVIKKIISNLSATLRGPGQYIWCEEQIAEKLNTPASKTYISLNEQFFAENITVDDIKQLLQQGADPNYRRLFNIHNNRKRGVDDCSPLSFYATNETDRNLTIVKCLLEHGAADVNKKIVVYWRFPLTIAIEKNLPKMVALFLSYNPVFCNDSSPDPCQKYLTQAIRQKNDLIIQLILDHQGDIDVKSALYEAFQQQNKDLMLQLFKRGMNPDEIIHLAVRSALLHEGNNVNILQFLCNIGITNQQMLDTALTRAKEAEERAKRVIAILENCNIGQ